MSATLAAPTAGFVLTPVPLLAAGGEAGHVAGVFDLGLVFGAGLLAGLAVWLLNRAQQSRRARNTEGRIRQMTALIEHADCLLWEAEVDITSDNWRWHMTLHDSAFCRKLFLGRPQVPGVDLWIQFSIDDREVLNRRARVAMEGGLPGYEQEFRAVRDGEAYWLHENVSITRIEHNRFWLVGLVTDITAQREAEEAKRQSELTLNRILANAQCLLWRATVILEDGVLRWPHFDIPNSQLSEALFGAGRVFAPERGFWDTVHMPAQAEMNERSSRAILGGHPGYTQQFQAINQTGRQFWLNEEVSITQVSEKSWSLVGVVTDITAQREAEEARQRTETQLSHLLKRADSMLWQARVERRPDGDLHWTTYIPKSQVYRRIFSSDPENPMGFAWDRKGVAEHAEMARRAYNAITSGAPGYDQVIQVPHPAGDIWLSETVTILSTGPGTWDLVGILTDITARRAAEQAWQASQARLAKLLELADCMVWEAAVSLRPDDTLAWDQYIPHSALYLRIFGEPHGKPRLRWDELEIPEYPEMLARTLRAVKTKAPGYSQEFHVVQPTGDIWLREVVTIVALAEGSFRMVGVITDITAQRRAEEAQQQSELRLSAILDRADCMIWQGEVRRLGPDEFRWNLFTPTSQLYRRLFGRDPEGECHFPWDNGLVPEQSEMQQRARDALTGGHTGYEQSFRYRLPSGDVWLNEQVTIKPVGPDHWELVGIITDVTVQHESEEARLASEQRLKELLSRANCLVWESTVEILPTGWKWNRNIQPSILYRRLTGSPLPAPTEPMWPVDRVPERAEMDRRCREALLGGRDGYEQVFHFVKPDGESVWISENVTVHRRGDSRYWLVGVAVDVTAQRQSEEARQASEQRLQDILTRAECLLWEASVTLSPSGWAWQMNVHPSRLCQKLYGAPKPSSEHGLWDGFVIPERQEMDQRARAAILGNRTGYEQVFRVIRPDGTNSWINESVTIRSTGPNQYSLVGVALDISAQRGAETELAAEKERLAVTLRAMKECVITTDVSGAVQFMNPAAATLIGWRVSEAFGRPVDSLFRLQSSRHDQPVEVPVARVTQGDVIVDLPPHVRLVTRTDNRRQIEGCCAPIHAADSKVIGTVLVFRDVTEQERLEQELVRATRLESVGVLAGGIAHDFNNILTAVMGNLALAQLDIPSDSPVGTSLRSAEKAALRARDLTQQLLTFAKGGEPVRAAVQLDAIVREMASFALHGSPVKAHYDMAPDLWPAYADKGQIGRVVQNLVINAVQAMPHGGTLQIVVRNDPHDGMTQPGLAAGDYIQIAITDTGEGIKPEHLSRIFDPYFTTKQTGTGLGLAAVYSIVKKHRGHIEVDSQPGQGTTFRIWLPALRGGPAWLDSRSPWGDSRSERMRGRVLFMDDEPSIRQMAVALLERFGLVVDCAVDGAEAVEKYRAAFAAGSRYDLVIMDLTVPGGMGGLAALGKLREIDPAVKAIVSSGYSSDPVMANYRAHGFVAMVAKPYETHEISRVLREVLPGGVAG